MTDPALFLSTQDIHGVAWKFFPADKKWEAEIEGKTYRGDEETRMFRPLRNGCAVGAREVIFAHS